MIELSHLSKRSGCGGKRKEGNENFIVEEIYDGIPVKELELEEKPGEYFVFLLYKEGITTYDSVSAIARKLGINIERISVAGQKDKNAITYQLASCWNKGLKKEDFLNLNCEIGKIKILKIWESDRKIEIGSLTGNRFKIKIEQVENIDNVEGIMEDNRNLIPNYFGPQRFGINNKNIEIGKMMLLKNYEGVVNNLISSVDGTNKGLYEK
ncbi:MAG: tRNA pseudouridine(13) synthase TruD, partial [Candidatus Micrarchaeota archaeon]|nr:tRNA pseudouridine(13) synthase TruD [Candidatus Micrarchaeota archaeon]